MKLNLHVIIDDYQYVKSNCFQHQLFKTLQDETNLSFSTISDVASGKSLPHADKFLSCLKLRTLYNNISLVKKYLNNQEIFVYEQDPWESFKDDSRYKGSYQKIYNELNVKSFLNTSKWWSNFIIDKGMKSTFVKMWVLPEYCSSDPPWKDREIDVGFCGQIHPYRKKFFDFLKSKNINVTILQQSSYNGFLQNLSKIKIFIHNEQVEWVVNSNKISANALWVKDIEAASRGCISIRDYEEECVNYTNNISSILTYKSFEESLDLITKTLDNVEETQEKINSSVEFIRNDEGWKSIINVIK